MFVQIRTPAENPVILLHAEDNAAIARGLVQAGQVIEVGNQRITASWCGWHQEQF
jgi:hypothetical protein